jgi:hypothetical protein
MVRPERNWNVFPESVWIAPTDMSASVVSAKWRTTYGDDVFSKAWKESSSSP